MMPSAIKSFGQAFLKSLRSREAEPFVARRNGRNPLRVIGIIRTRFLQVDFRRYFVKILENPQRIFCVLCLVSPKIHTVKNLRPENELFLLDFWG